MHEWQSDPGGEIVGSEYVVPPNMDLGGSRDFERERIIPAPRVLSADEVRVLRRNRDMFFGPGQVRTGQVAAHRNSGDNWEWVDGGWLRR